MSACELDICRRVSGEETVKATVTLLRDELVYDIEQYAYVEGDMARDNQGEGTHATHQVFDVGEQGNENLMARALGLAVCECREMLYPLTKRPMPADYAVVNELKAPDKYIIAMQVPATLSATTLEYIKELVHKYCIVRVLSEWMSITKPQSAAAYAAQGEELMAKMNSAAKKRTNAAALRITQHYY